MILPDLHTLTSLDALEALYDAPSKRVRLKQIDRLDAHCRAFIAASPVNAPGDQRRVRRGLPRARRR